MRVKRGFTLIEILIVIVIIGIVSAVSIVAFGDFGAGRKAQVFAEQFAAYIKLVRQRAILEMSTLGINVTSKGYDTWRYDYAKSWQPLSKTSLFRWQAFPDNIVVKLNSRIKNNNNTPDIILQSSGDMSEFTLVFGTRAQPQQIMLTGENNGVVTMKAMPP